MALNKQSLFVRLKKTLGQEIRTDFFGPSKVKRIAVVTGGGASFIPHAYSLNVDAYITGEHKAFLLPLLQRKLYEHGLWRPL